MTEIRLRIVVPFHGRELTSDLTVDPATPVATLVDRLIADHRLPGTAADWALTLHGDPLAASLGAGELVRRVGGVVGAGVLTGLVLVRRSELWGVGGLAAGPPAKPSAPPSAVARPSPRPRTEPEANTFGDDADADEMTSASAVAEKARRKRKMVTRRATVRYYSRMNPERMFPLLVVLSAEEIEQVVKKAVKQAESAGFKVEVGTPLVVEPVLPGCDCYPPAETLTADPQPVTATFWVVPRVLGRVQGARVVLRQNGRVLSEVPLDVKVSRQTAAVVLGLLGLFAPYLTIALKAARLDFESQQQDGFPVYRMAGAWCADNVRPEWLGFGLLGLAVLSYFWARPKRRDVFWDVTPRPVTA